MSDTSRPADVHLRQATIADAPVLSALARRLFVQTFGPANTEEDMRLYLASAFSDAKQAAELSDPDRIVWMVETRGDDAVGYVSLKRNSPLEETTIERAAEIERIYVDASLHGAGAGAMMMRQSIEQARAWEREWLWLAVWERNPRAIAFYRKSGFEPVGMKTFQLGTDPQRDVVMARKL